MAFDWSKYYDVGEHLLTLSGEEYLRSAISRFYYACFGLSKKYFEDNYSFLEPEDVHADLIKKLEGSPYDEEQDLGHHLRKLRRYRNNADYDSKLHRDTIRNFKKEYQSIKKLILELNKKHYGYKK